MTETPSNEPESNNGWTQRERRIDAGICPEHEEQHKNIQDIANSMSRQDGQWKILMWGGGILFGALVSLGFLMNNTLHKTQSVVIEMDKTFTVYMMMHMDETKRGLGRIEDSEAMLELHDDVIKNHEIRLKKLEGLSEN